LAGSNEDRRLQDRPVISASGDTKPAKSAILTGQRLSLKEGAMTIFITQGRYSQQAMKGLVAKPEDRDEEVRKLFERGGCKLLNYYMTFGEYDFLIVSDAPNANAILSVLAVAAAGGGVTDIKTTLAVTTADAKKAFASAKKSASEFRSAGQS
jgi:uncharacterized protein with GYD domain